MINIKSDRNTLWIVILMLNENSWNRLIMCQQMMNIKENYLYLTAIVENIWLYANKWFVIDIIIRIR